jgi:quinoprotein glucose dehydrogenase
VQRRAQRSDRGVASWLYQGAALAIAAAGVIAIGGWSGAADPDVRGPHAGWRDYGGAPDSMQYSAHVQVDRGNVATLQQAWFYAVEGDAVRLGFNPLIVDEVMYVRGAKGRLVALDAATGREIWRSTEEAFDRGVSYWESADRTDRRLMVTSRNGLRQVDARTGRLITTFGDGGTVDMRSGAPRRLGGPNKTPGRIFENLVIVGSLTGEGYGSPPGDIRAYDVRTGALVWTFHTVPRPGEFGYETWPAGAHEYAGGVNNWGEMTVDVKHGLVFVPLGSPTHDLYGADRVGDNLFGNSLVALDARTGARRWHFQTVHHDLWDYDLAAAPKLLTVRHDGRSVDIVAQAGKTGFLYVFERLTGKPLWPIEERRVPKSDVPGEVSSPTQPFPTRPAPFARQSFTPDDVNPFVSADEQAALKQAVREAASEGLFTPASHTRYHIQFPGAWGGANWGSTAADPATGMLYVRSLEMPSYRKLARVEPKAAEAPVVTGGPRERLGYDTFVQTCAACHGSGAMPMRSPAALGAQQFRRLVRQGQAQMPAFPEAALPDAQLEALEAYLLTLGTADDGDRGDANAPLRLPANPARYQGPAVRYAGAFSAGWYASNGLPASGPPFTQLVAYDLNDGSVKWRIADGTSPGLAAQGITGTGSVRPKNGPVVTAGGLVFIANDQDRRLRAYDKADGRLLWEHEIPANPEGIPAIYAVGGRQYIAFSAGASWGTGSDPVWRNGFHRKPSEPKDQGYYVFALPANTTGARSR